MMSRAIYYAAVVAIVLATTPIGSAQTTDAERFEAAQKKLLEKQRAAATQPSTTKPATGATSKSTAPRLEPAIQQLHKAAIETFNNPKARGVAADPRDPLTIKQFNDMAEKAVVGKTFDLSFNLVDSDTIKDWMRKSKINRDGLRGVLQSQAKSPLVAKSHIPLEIPQQAQAEMRDRLADMDKKLTAKLREEEAASEKGTPSQKKYHAEEAKKAKANRDKELAHIRNVIADTSIFATVLLSTDDPELLAMKAGIPKMINVEVVKVAFEPWGVLDDKEAFRNWAESGKLWVIIKPAGANTGSGTASAGAPAKTAAEPAGVVFAIDATDGMAASQRAISAQVQAALRSMPEGSKFNIVAIADGKITSLSPAMVTSSPENVTRASLYLESLPSAGAENFPALLTEVSKHRPETVWFCSDGNFNDAFAVQEKMVGIAKAGEFKINTVTNWIPQAPSVQHKSMITLVSLAEGSGGTCLNGGKRLKLADVQKFDAAKPVAPGTSIFTETP